MKVASFFSGAGGLDLGFVNAGFEVVFANDNWKGCWETYKKNHGININRRSIEDIKPHEIPDVDGFIGGPPCQSWSLAGAMKGIEDPRGQLLYHYVRLIEEKEPLFFLAENVPGMVCKTHQDEFNKFVNSLKKLGYTTNYQVLNANDYNVPQDRKRVFIIGFSDKFDNEFKFPAKSKKKLNLKDAIGDLEEPLPALNKNKPNKAKDLAIFNHEYMTGDFSSMYMSRNRVRNWNEPSFTIQAGGRHAPCHPQANKMIKIEKDKQIFDPETPKPYRRLSVRECARIQTFPDDFIFYYNNIADGYKMIGNAVPVKLAEAIGKEINKFI
ncbi:MAG: DNA cytosine methyltransferase [Methanobrevibacter sp.]|jgi:DNA (cytosine-5)-methyltransferase 1|nr:DNA cytosine methyltransferase [Candidatus Methanoflexus mossambicus]